MRTASRMRTFPPSGDQVAVLVTLTRCHYAQLAQQRYSAPRGWPMPPPDSPGAKAADLGAKLVVGAEVLCARAEARSACSQPPGQERVLSEAEVAAGMVVSMHDAADA